MRKSFCLLVAALVAFPVLWSSPAAAGGIKRPGRYFLSFQVAGTQSSGRLTGRITTDSPGLVGSVSAEYLEPFEGPEPYERSISLAPNGEASARARTRIGFNGNAVGFAYPLTVTVKGRFGIIARGIKAEVRRLVDITASSEGGGGDGDDAVTAAIVALADKDGDGAPDAYRITVDVFGDLATSVEKVEIQFNDAFEGPAPHATLLGVPFKTYHQWFEADGLLFDGDPSGSSYDLLLTPLDLDGKALAEADSRTLRVRRKRSLPQVNALATRTAPVLLRRSGRGCRRRGGLLPGRARRASRELCSPQRALGTKRLRGAAGQRRHRAQRLHWGLDLVRWSLDWHGGDHPTGAAGIRCRGCRVCRSAP
jgi:hypothetical protein